MICGILVRVCLGCWGDFMGVQEVSDFLRKQEFERFWTAKEIAREVGLAQQSTSRNLRSLLARGDVEEAFACVDTPWKRVMYRAKR